MLSKIRSLQRGVLDYLVRHNAQHGLEQRAESFVRLFEKNIPPHSKVLDVGGGWGFYYEPMARRGHHLTVLDVVKPGLQKCPVIVYDGGRFPFPDKSFDVTLFITVLHHISDLERTVLEARRVTRKVIIVVEDLYHHQAGRFWTILRDRIYNMEFFGHPCNFKTRTEWVRFFEEKGFESVEDDRLYTWLAGLRILNGIFILKLKD